MADPIPFPTEAARAELSNLRRAISLEKRGEPPYDGGMEARIAKLETALEFVQRDIGELRTDVRAIRTTDFRILFGAIITVALGLAGLMGKGFHWF